MSRHVKDKFQSAAVVFLYLAAIVGICAVGNALRSEDLAHCQKADLFEYVSPNAPLPEGRMTAVRSDLHWGGVGGYVPMAAMCGQENLTDYQDACGSSTTPGLSGNVHSNPAFRERLIRQGRIILLAPGTHVVVGEEVEGAFIQICVAEGDYKGTKGIVFLATIKRSDSDVQKRSNRT